MKKIALVALLLAALYAAALPQGHTLKTGSLSRPTPQLITATAFKIDSVPTADCVHLVVWNDTTAGTDTLWVAAENDTTRVNLVPVYKGESVNLSGLRARWIRRKTSANTVHSRTAAW